MTIMIWPVNVARDSLLVQGDRLTITRILWARGRPQGSPPRVNTTPAPTMTTAWGGWDVHC
ncbi:MAG TPA: hypothetical protein VKR83_20125, partial [Ktedonobacteraceae bacterium]|nr:hypothetical protein [Ktedonobacteraceae bacterium]